MAARALLVALALALLAVGPAAAEPVRVRSSPHDGYGRLVFNWQSPVRFEAAIVDQRLVVRFARPIEADYGAAARGLARYVGAAEPGADGASVAFPLRRPVALRSFDLGSAVVVDLMDRQDAAAEATGAPPAPAEAADAGPRVRVRTGEHDGYSRVVFDWPGRVGFEAEKVGETVRVRFDRPARFDLGRLAGRPMTHVRGARAAAAATGSEVTLSVADGAGLRTARLGPKVVVDVLAAPPATTSPSPSPAPAPVAEAPEPAPAPIPDEAPPPAPPAEPVAEGPPPTPLTPEAVAEAPAPPATPAAPVADAAPPTTLDKVGLRFSWDEPVAAAVFRRAGYLWAVFDKPSEPDLEALRAAAGNVLRDVEQIAEPKATVLRMTTVGGVNPTVKRDGLDWVFELRQQPLEAARPIESKAQPTSPAGPRVFLPVPEPGEAIAVTDPEVGDTLVVVPVVPLGHGIPQAYEYPEVRILPSAQGVVLKPKIDTLRVRPLRQGVELTSSRGLSLSPVAQAARAGAEARGARGLSRVLDFGRWRAVGRDAFVDDERRLQWKAATAAGAERELARLDLARFYLAHGFAPETLGVMRVIARDRPEAADEAESRMIVGAAKFLLGRLDATKADFSHPSLEGNDEAAFWRAAVTAFEGDASAVGEELSRTGAVVGGYPKAIKMPLGLRLVEAAIDIGDIRLASRQLDLLLTEQPDDRQLAQLDYVDGKLLALSGDFDGAIGKWEQVELGRHRPSRAKAALARAELLLELDQITRAEALDEMEKLRFAWRGDDFEFGLLRRMGELYLEEGGYGPGLRTLRQAATHFREHAEAPTVTERMADTFEALYLEGQADEMEPVAAIALYDEFRELTPVGEKGNEMIRKLADRLVAVDLLDRAAALLDNQVRFRLKGEEKARVGARLAVIHSLAREPETVIETLKETAVDGIPDALAAQRRHLEARARADLGQIETALTMLDDDDSQDADLIRTDIYWQIRDWPRVAQVLRRVIRSTGARPGSALDDGQARHVLNLAVALTLADNEQGLARVRREYGGSMDATPFRDAFRLVASPRAVAIESIDLGDIATDVAEVENFQTFMAAYRERLRAGELSAIN